MYQRRCLVKLYQRPSAYQLARKIQLLKYSFNKWKNEEKSNVDKSSFMLLEKLNDTQTESNA